MIDPHRVLGRAGGAEQIEQAGPVLRLYRMASGPFTFGCVRCGHEQRARVVAVVEDRAFVCRSCYDVLKRSVR
jgi:hypothetical protein